MMQSRRSKHINSPNIKEKLPLLEKKFKQRIVPKHRFQESSNEKIQLGTRKRETIKNFRKIQRWRRGLMKMAGQPIAERFSCFLIYYDISAILYGFSGFIGFYGFFGFLYAFSVFAGNLLSTNSHFQISFYFRSSYHFGLKLPHISIILEFIFT